MNENVYSRHNNFNQLIAVELESHELGCYMFYKYSNKSSEFVLKILTKFVILEIKIIILNRLKIVYHDTPITIRIASHKIKQSNKKKIPQIISEKCDEISTFP